MGRLGAKKSGQEGMRGECEQASTEAQERGREGPRRCATRRLRIEEGKSEEEWEGGKPSLYKAERG